VRVFIGVSVHACCERLRCTVLKKTSYIGSPQYLGRKHPLQTGPVTAIDEI